MSVLSVTPEITGEPRRKLWTREEVTQLSEMGFFEGRRYELIDGELIDKMGQNPPHAVSIQCVFEQFLLHFAARRVRVQLPIEVRQDDQRMSEPEPDFTVTEGTRADYIARHPAGNELVVLVEVSDSTARMDRIRKLRLYARAGVPEYWVLDLQQRQLFVYRRPEGDGYSEAVSLQESEAVVVPGSPGATMLVSSLLP